MARKTGLGKGLDALIPTWQDEISSDSSTRIVQVSLNKIKPNPQQPRKNFDPSSLEELANSIREHGILQPLILVQTDGTDQYNLIAGERRWRAASLAGLTQVPAIVRTASHQEQLEFAIIENVQREDLNPLERARAYQSLIDEFSLTHDEIAQRVGKNRVTVTNTLRLLVLPEVVQQALLDEVITEGHARALLSLASPKAMEAALETVLNLGLNVRQTELLVSKLSGKTPKTVNQHSKSAEVLDLENRLRQLFHTKVTLQPSNRGGSITIYYYSDEELNDITGRLGMNE
ncbi:MAG: ParB/RepB/Spo0J family partition protein [Anaerolineaceae bacterium]|jgi:ParB family chromosome partitioning protein